MLDNLIKPAAASGNNSGTVSRETAGIVWVPLDQIHPNPFQTRLGEDPDHILNLARSIADQKASLPDTLGLQQVPVARLIEHLPTGRVVLAGDHTYADPLPALEAAGAPALCQLAFGHSRAAAFRLLAHGPSADFLPSLVGAEQLLPAPGGHPDLDYARLPVRLVRLDDRQMWQQAVEENAARKDINAIEEARSLKQAIDAFGLTAAEAGRPFGLARSTVANKLRLLDLPAEIQDQIAAGAISEKHGRELLRLADAPDVLATVAAAAGSLSTRDLADRVEKERKGVEARREKERQIAVVRERFPDIPLHVDDGYHSGRSEFREGGYYADSALIDAGICGPGKCDCFALCWRDWGNLDDYARPLPEDAPKIVYVCNNDDACRGKAATLRAEARDRNQAIATVRREVEERKQRQRAAVDRIEAEAQRLIAAFVEQRSPADLWGDLRFWKEALLGERLRGAGYREKIAESESLAEMQRHLVAHVLRGSEKWQEVGEGGAWAAWAADLDAIKARIRNLGGTPAPIREQPAPGDSQETNWQEGWTDEDEAHWEELLDLDDYLYIDGENVFNPECIQRPRVALRLIEDVDSKAARAALWKRHNHLTDDSFDAWQNDGWKLVNSSIDGRWHAVHHGRQRATPTFGSEIEVVCALQADNHSQDLYWIDDNGRQ